MNNAESQLRVASDVRLAGHADSLLPAWLWSMDGTRILWANAAGANLFGAADAAGLNEKIFGPADPHRRQVAKLAGRLPATGAARLERLRGFGATLGMLVTCACSRLEFTDGGAGILVVAAEPVRRAMPRVAAPVQPVAPAALIEPPPQATEPGHLTEAVEATGQSVAQPLPEPTPVETEPVHEEAHLLVEQQIEKPAPTDLVQEQVEEPEHTIAEHQPDVLVTEEPTPEYEATASTGEAPAEFALIDEFMESPPEPDAEHIAANEPREPGFGPPTMVQFDAPHVDASHAESRVEAVYAGPSVETATATHTEAATPVSEEVRDETPPPIEAVADELPSHIEAVADEPSPYVEAVADEPAPTPAIVSSQVAEAEPPLPPPEPPAAKPPAPPWPDETLVNARKHPLRFMWQMDAEGRFVLGSDEFARLIGARTASGFGRLWSEIADVFGMDPEGRVAKAFATRDTWSGITVNWPVDGGARLPVELSGLPMLDRARNFAGYRGFGVCRDLDGLNRLAALRRYEFFSDPPTPQPLSADIVQAGPAQDLPTEDISVEDISVEDNTAEDMLAEDLPAQDTLAAEPSAETVPPPQPPELPALIASETSQQTNLETPVENPKNVLPFRPVSEPKSPALTPVENSAFNELARQLSARLDTEPGADTATPPTLEIDDTVIDQTAVADLSAAEEPAWLTQPETPARGETLRDRTLLDLVPVGVLIYRLDRLLYANRAFLERMGYDSLHALEEAGGLDALYVEPGVSNASSTSGTGTPVTISAMLASPEHASPSPTDAHLFTIEWDGESAHTLIFANARPEPVAIAQAIVEAVPAAEPSAVGHANAEELGAILDTTAEGIVMFDAEGAISAGNRSAEALFGYDGAEFVQRNLTELFAPESQRVVLDYLQSIKDAGAASLDHGREVLGRVRGGGLIPISMTMGRTQANSPNFFAVFRDLSQAKKSESELLQARRSADRASGAKADLLARISHEVRTPLNAIIGFAEVMIGERFGALGNERYVEYMKDIRASGERVIGMIDDLLDLSRIETGKLDLAFANQNLNDLVEQCVAVMQPQANRERIIIRTSLAHALPPVVADAGALRQIALNLIGNSIHLANAGGQVIVSTALSDFGEVVLRVRDTGHGLNDNEVAAAMEPFRTQPPADQTSGYSGVSLSLTKALVEANGAQFQIKTGAHSGTLIEVTFSHAAARA